MLSEHDDLAVCDFLEYGFPIGFLDTKVNLTFPRVDDLVEIIKIKGKCCHLFRRDLKRAYRQIPVNPGDVSLLGYYFENSYYFDLYLSMGLGQVLRFANVSLMQSGICV